eukprot:gene10266-2415_t
MSSFLPKVVAAATAAATKNSLPDQAQAILEYWFSTDKLWPPSRSTTDLDIMSAFLDPIPEKMRTWFFSSKDTDNEISARFSKDLLALDDNPDVYNDWKRHDNPRATLALIILTDQFSRNILRGTAKSFAYDHLALSSALAMLSDGRTKLLRPIEQFFCLLPLEHSENLEHHEQMKNAIDNLKQNLMEFGVDDAKAAIKFCDMALQYLEEHTKVLRQFGRYPHRNKVLQRVSTPEEVEYLKTAETWGQ